MGIRPCVVALIIAPVITSAKAAKITWKTVWIPILVAGLIYIGWNPIVFIVLGGLCGYIWLTRQQKLLEARKTGNDRKEGDDK